MVEDTKTDGGRRRNRWRIAAWSTAGAFIFLPLIAMLFTGHLAWDLPDFVFAGLLVLGVGLTFEFAVRVTRSTAYRAAVGVALAAAFILIWINLAVGIIGNENNPANLLYFGVLAFGILGALIARFQAHGMSRALFATALAQVLVAVIAFIAGFGFTGPITVFFAGLWIISGCLFRKAAREGLRRS